MAKTFYSNGKLMLTGEYVVLDGATSLALPTKYGQSLLIEECTEQEHIVWKSVDVTNNIWFHDVLLLDHLSDKIISKNKPESTISQTLISVLEAARKLNPLFLNKEQGLKITTKLDFPRNWGLGTSSTLIYNIAQWAQVNSFSLLWESFGGSGYDIAAAQYNKAILYNRFESPRAREVYLPWEFKEQLFFVHLKKKQNSKEGIAHYKKASVSKNQLQRITDLTHKLILCYDIKGFEKIMESHEMLISKIIKQPPVKEVLFSDYKRNVKSLGAWGGDFVLVTGCKSDMNYFKEKGYHTIIPFSEIIKPLST